MGAATSREIQQRLQAGSANEIADDPEFQDFLRNSAWPEASDRLKAQFTELTHIPRDRLKPLFEADLSSRLSPAGIQTLCQLAQGDVDPIAIRVSTNPVDAYVNLHVLTPSRTRSYVEDVVRRCQLFVFHLLKEQFERDNLGIRPAAFANAIAVGINEPPAKVLPNVRYWTRSGSLLHRLASELGGFGVLLVLPSTVSRSIWESHLSPNTPRYGEAIQFLEANGLCEYADEQGAYAAGDFLAQRFGLVPTGRFLMFPSKQG